MDKLSTERSCQYHLLQAGGTSDFRLQIVDCEFKNDSIVFQSAFRNQITHALAAGGTDMTALLKAYPFCLLAQKSLEVRTGTISKSTKSSHRLTHSFSKS